MFIYVAWIINYNYIYLDSQYSSYNTDSSGKKIQKFIHEIKHSIKIERPCQIQMLLKHTCIVDIS